MKGSVLDVILIPAVVLFIIFAVIFVYIFLDNFSTAFSTLSIATETSKTALTTGLASLKFWDQAIIILIGGLFIVSLIGASMVNAHPMLFVGAVGLLIVFIFIGAQMSNFFIEFASTAGISNVANEFPLTIQFFQNLPLFLLVFGVAISVVMFSFGGRGNEYGI